MEIKGRRMILRPITEADTDLIVKWRNDEAVRSCFVFQEPFTKELHENWLKTMVFTGKVVQYMIILKEHEEPIGSVYFQNIDKKNSSAEYGIFIGNVSKWGQGYGTEAAELFVKFGFEELGLHRITLRVFADNIQAIRSYTRVGFCQEGVAREMVYQKGFYRDMVFMSILEGEQNL